MRIDPQDLRRQYASLSDEALLALNRNDLIEVAQRCYDDELASRGLARRRAVKSSIARDHEATPQVHAVDAVEFDDGDGSQPAWFEEAACACTFVANPGSDAAAQAANAREALKSAGIPCEISQEQIDPDDGDSPPRYEYRVMVPGALNLWATSVLDKEIFNPELEAEWMTHLEALSSEELRALTPEKICAGFLDRAERLRKAYEDEIARRKLGLPH